MLPTLILAITFLLRAFPGLIKIVPTNSDELYHLLIAQQIRKNNFKYPDKIKKFLISGIYNYPPLFHYLLSLLPQKKLWRPMLRSISAIVDTIHVLILYIFSLYLVETLKIGSTSLIPCIAMLMFATSPALIYYGVGPRSFHATPRTLSELFFTLCFLFYALYVWEKDAAFLVTSIFFAALVLLTSKFGAQSLIFFSIIVAILENSIIILAVPISGVALAYVLSFGHYKDILIGWIKHLILYKKTISKLHPITKARNDLGIIKRVMTSFLTGEIYNTTKILVKKLPKTDRYAFTELSYNELVKAIFEIMCNNTLIILITRNILLLVVIYISYKNLELILSSKLLSFLLFWVIASFITFFLTSFKPFLFLGEAERYLEYSITAQVILFAIFVNNMVVVNSFVTYNLAYYIFTIFMIYTVHKSRLTEEEAKSELLNWIKSKNIKNKNILTIDMTFYEIPLTTENYILRPSSLSVLSEDEFKEVFIEYPYPNVNLAKLVNKYKIDLICVKKKSLDYCIRRGWNYDFSQFIKVYENEEYVVYSTSKLQS